MESWKRQLPGIVCSGRLLESHNICISTPARISHPLQLPIARVALATSVDSRASAARWPCCTAASTWQGSPLGCEELRATCGLQRLHASATH
jgi:hypothetical protein